MEELLELFKSGQIAIWIEYKNELFKNFVEYLDEAGWTTRPFLQYESMTASEYTRINRGYRYLCTSDDCNYLNMCNDTYAKNANLTIVKVNDFIGKKECLYEVELDELI